ncbi:MAG: purine-nucleoside phosphorylase [Bacteroidales bacterium]|nr:purine-nucleoside phosphorylase [Bacteroidales bacterium]
MDNSRMERIRSAAQSVAERLDGRVPLVGIVLGSGLGDLADKIKDPVVIPYNTIPGFPVSTAVGHKGNFIAGKLASKCVIAMQGRFHYYEGYPMELLALPIRVMKLLGIQYLFVSNAAGGANPDFKIGDMVIIKDHINNLPNPLIGQNLEEFGPRFPDLTCAYDLDLQEKAMQLGMKLGLDLKKGVYFASSGPTYETPAEVRFYRTVGADMLGMSTVPEVIVARHCGLKVFGVSVITNVANVANEQQTYNDADDVVAQAGLITDKMCKLFTELIKKL